MVSHSGKSSIYCMISSSLIDFPLSAEHHCSDHENFSQAFARALQTNDRSCFQRRETWAWHHSGHIQAQSWGPHFVIKWYPIYWKKLPVRSNGGVSSPLQGGLKLRKHQVTSWGPLLDQHQQHSLQPCSFCSHTAGQHAILNESSLKEDYNGLAHVLKKGVGKCKLVQKSW